MLDFRPCVQIRADTLAYDKAWPLLAGWAQEFAELTPPEGFNYKGAGVSLASALSACGSDRGQRIQLRAMAARGKSCLCDRQQRNTGAQEAGEIQGGRRGEQ